MSAIYRILNFPVATLRETDEIRFDIFYLSQSKVSAFPRVIITKIIIHTLFLYEVFEIQCVCYSYSTC